MKKLHPTRLRNAAEFARSIWHVEVDPDVTIEDVMTPGYWQHHVAKIQIHDIIEIIGQGFDIQLRATGKGIGYVETRLLRKWTDDVAVASKPAPDLDVPEGYVVDHTPKTLWRVRLKDGGVEVKRDIKTRSEAVDTAVAHAMRASGIAA
jgi:hypothetical protein